MRQRARILRHHQTDAEKRLWRYLRNRGLKRCKFRRQYPVGPYIVDFACLERHLIIEIDGGQHAEQVQYDGIRTRFLEGEGFHVMRFWNNDVLSDTDAVLESVLTHLL